MSTKIDTGVMVYHRHSNKAWGTTSPPQARRVYGWVDQEYATLYDPLQVRAPEDAALPNNPEGRAELLANGVVFYVRRQIHVQITSPNQHKTKAYEGKRAISGGFESKDLATGEVHYNYTDSFPVEKNDE